MDEGGKIAIHQGNTRAYKQQKCAGREEFGAASMEELWQRASERNKENIFPALSL
jgi:hypothetical protein